jgi:hypothetical protein
MKRLMIVAIVCVTAALVASAPRARPAPVRIDGAPMCRPDAPLVRAAACEY